MNKWSLFHWLQSKPIEVRDAVAKGWHSIEWRNEHRVRVGSGCECCCDYDYKTMPAGWYGHPPEVPTELSGMYKLWAPDRRLIVSLPHNRNELIAAE